MHWRARRKGHRISDLICQLVLTRMAHLVVRKKFSFSSISVTVGDIFATSPMCFTLRTRYMVQVVKNVVQFQFHLCRSHRFAGFPHVPGFSLFQS